MFVEVKLPVSGYIAVEVEVPDNSEENIVDMALRSALLDLENGYLANEDIEEWRVHKSLKNLETVVLLDAKIEVL